MTFGCLQKGFVQSLSLVNVRFPFLLEQITSAKPEKTINYCTLPGSRASVVKRTAEWEYEDEQKRETERRKSDIKREEKYQGTASTDRANYVVQ